MEEDQKIKHINIRVGGEGDDVSFKIKRNTHFSKLFNAYANKTGKSLESMKFMFDGTPVKPEQTPEDLEMEDEDKIDVVVSQVGGAEEDDKKIEHVNIKVVGSNGNEVCKSILPYQITEAFKIKKTASLAKLMSAYVNKMGVERSAVRFQFDGAELQGHETPESLNLEDDDTIEVLNTQIGGFSF